MLGVQVHPRRGSAVLFCNILPDHSPDKRTIHRALPVQGNKGATSMLVLLDDCNGGFGLVVSQPRGCGNTE